MLALASTQVLGQTTKKWDRGAGTDNWADANNWEPNGVPAAGDAVVLDHSFYTTGSYSVNMPNSAVSIGSLNISPSLSTFTITVEIPTITPAASAVGKLTLTSTGFNTLRIGNRGRLNNRHGGGANFRSVAINDSTNFGMLLDVGGYYLHNTLSRDLPFLYNLDARSNSTFEYQRNVTGTDNGFMVFPAPLAQYPVLTQVKFHHLILSGSVSPSPVFSPIYAVTLARNWNLVVEGDLTVRNNATLGLLRGGPGQETRTVSLKGNVSITSAANPGMWLDATVPVHLGWNVVFNGSSQQNISGDIAFGDRVEISNPSGVVVSNTMFVKQAFFYANTPGMVLTNGLLTTTGSGLVNVSLTAPGSVSGHSANSYVNGKLVRSVSGTGIYDFPVGTATKYELATLNLSAVTGVTTVTAEFLTSGLGNIPTPLAESGLQYGGLLDAGFWRITSNAAMSGGSYSLTLNQRGFTATAADRFTVAKRTNGAAPWALQGTHVTYNQTASVITAQRSGMSGFSDFAVASAFSQFTWTGNVSTDWDNAGNWNSNSVPSITGTALIPTNPSGNRMPTVNIASAGVDDITIQSGATLTISNGNALTVDGQLTNNGTVVVWNNASLVQTINGALVGGGTFQVERIGSSVYDFWSAPVSNTQVSFLGGTVYQYNPQQGTADYSDDAFDPGWVAASGIMTQGKGYATSGAGSKTFNGTVNNGPIDIGVTAHALPNVSWNLIGNPYPSGISVNNFLTANSGQLAVGAVYLWDDPGTGVYVTGDYATRNGTGGTAGGGGNIPTATIGTAQGFKVQVNGNGLIHFTNAMRTTGNTSMLFRQEESEDKRLWLSAKSDANRYTQTLIGFMQDATDGEDWLYDAPKMNPLGELSLYSFGNGQSLAIQGFASLNEPRTVPLGVHSAFECLVTIALDSTDNMVQTGIILEDRHENLFHDLRSSAYTFTTQAALHSDRFFLHINAGQAMGIDEVNSAPCMSAWFNDGFLFVKTTSEPMETIHIQLVDIQGRSVWQQAMNNPIITADLSNLDQGIYVVQLLKTSGACNLKVVR